MKKKLNCKKSEIPDYTKKIIGFLKEKRGSVKYKTLLKEMRGKRFNFTEFSKSLESLKNKGIVSENDSGIRLVGKNKQKRARITKLNKTFGFARILDTDEEVFISGRNLLGALPGDIVKLVIYKGSGDSPEGEVTEIEEKNFSAFTGIVVGKDFNLLIPDIMPQYEMIFSNPLSLELHSNDKVTARIVKRGKRHSEHRCEITACFGNAKSASVCVEGMLSASGVNVEFADEVLKNAREVENYEEIQKELKNRTDLRHLPIFTIDSAYTKDIDDAISVKKTRDGFELGVHIADVSYYVKQNSPLDNEAFERGTSIYFADRVVPMLPPELSNGICSLNSKEDRLAFSCLMKIDKLGKLKDFDFKKTVIRTRVKGVYSEINEILSGKKTKQILEKYSEVIDTFSDMKELASLLKKNRINRGAPQIESTEGAVILNENGECIGVKRIERGESEEIIEDFMLTANEAAARFGRENDLPFVYRIHEDPNPEKIRNLSEVLSVLGIPHSFDKGVSPKSLSSILEYVKGKESSVIVNSLVLRSMAKARYSGEPVGHFGLVLKDYAHFTSPIRRYPDLAIHRIMSDFLSGTDKSEIRRKYSRFARAASERSSETEVKAMNLERSCDDFYKAEYLSNRIGEETSGIIISVADFGFFVMLDDTCEGLVRIETLPNGQYYINDFMTLRNNLTGEKYSVGERVTVKILNANVSSGKVDFEFVSKADAGSLA